MVVQRSRSFAAYGPIEPGATFGIFEPDAYRIQAIQRNMSSEPAPERSLRVPPQLMCLRCCQITPMSRMGPPPVDQNAPTGPAQFFYFYFFALGVLILNRRGGQHH